MSDRIVTAKTYVILDRKTIESTAIASFMNDFGEISLTNNDNLTLILLSMSIAATACYTALRLRTNSDRPRWLGSIALGLGIWATALTGLLVIKEPDVSWSPWLIVLSSIVAIAAAHLALNSESEIRSPIRWLRQGSFWGLAIAVTHYLILASAVTLSDSDILIKCNLWLFLLSLIIPTGLSALALYCHHETMTFASVGFLSAAILGSQSIAPGAIQIFDHQEFNNGPLWRFSLETSWAVEKSSVMAAIVLAFAIIVSLMLSTFTDRSATGQTTDRESFSSQGLSLLNPEAPTTSTQEPVSSQGLSLLNPKAPTTSDRQPQNPDAALKADRDRLAGIVDIADDAIITINDRQRITLFNQGAEKIFGYSADQVLGQSLDMLLPENARKIHPQHIQEFSRSTDQTRKMGDRRAIFARRRDGSEFPGEASISQLVVGSEKIFTVILRDISDRVEQETALRQAYEQSENLETRIDERTAELKTANLELQAEIAERQHIENILRESEQRYQTLANVAPVGIFHTNAEGKCLYVNDRWCEIAGMTREEALGDGWINPIHPEDREQVFAQWDRAAKANQLFKYEYRFLSPDGLETWVLGWAGADRDENRQLLGYVGTITDISDRKRIEKQLHQSQQELEQRVQQRTAELAKATVALRDSQARPPQLPRPDPATAGGSQLFVPASLPGRCADRPSRDPPRRREALLKPSYLHCLSTPHLDRRALCGPCRRPCHYAQHPPRPDYCPDLPPGLFWPA